MIMDNNNISDNRLDGNVALITGSSSGIGAGTAVLFSRLGADLSITGRNEANLRKTAEECEKFSGKKPLAIIADLVKESDVIRVIDDTIQHFGKLDILVNNAGIAESGTLFSTSLTQFDRVMDINVRSVFHLTKLAVPHLIKTKGRIVNVSSLSSNRPYPNILAYCMSKSAIDQFTKCLALELAPKQVRVNSVNPGFISTTEIFKRAGMTDEQYQKYTEKSKSTHPMGRIGEIQDVAKTIAFLASDQSSYITGSQIPIDGGKGLICPN